MKIRSYVVAGVILLLGLGFGWFALGDRLVVDSTAVDASATTNLFDEDDRQSVRSNIHGDQLRAFADLGDRLLLPPELALLPGESIPRASNWSELVAEMSPEDQQLAETLATSYPEAYAFSTIEQLEWMLKAGYPMPQEFVSAMQMSRQELSRLAGSGNVKALLLDMDRYLRDEAVLDSEEWLQEGAEHLGRFVSAKKSSCSPFYGYLQIKFIERYYTGSDYGVFAELARIRASGDWRVTPVMHMMEAEGLVPAGASKISAAVASDIYNCGLSKLPG